jgi:hypothetical protein
MVGKWVSQVEGVCHSQFVISLIVLGLRCNLAWSPYVWGFPFPMFPFRNCIRTPRVLGRWFLYLSVCINHIAGLGTLNYRGRAFVSLVHSGFRDSFTFRVRRHPWCFHVWIFIGFTRRYSSVVLCDIVFYTWHPCRLLPLVKRGSIVLHGLLLTHSSLRH